MEGSPPRFVPPPEPPPPRPPEAREGSLLSRLDLIMAPLQPSTVERGAIVFALGLGALDFALGPDVVFSLFYFLPIALAAWYGEGRAGYFLATVAGACWVGVEVLSGVTYPLPWIFPWNTGVRVGTFLVVAALTIRLRESLQVQRALALSDPLTGLANTRAFLDHLNSEIERSSRYGRIFTLAYVDLDRFKEVNDTRGHAEGDEVLRRVARTMTATMRTTDLPARLGGDEFGLLLPETPFAQAEWALEKLRSELLRTMEMGGWPVTFSVGAVTFEAPIGSADEAIRIADRLMYEVKNSGRDAIRHILWTGEQDGE